MSSRYCFVILVVGVVISCKTGAAQTSGSGSGLSESGYFEDECNTNTHTCSDHAICSITNEGRRCLCMTGYTGNGYNCTDVNECAEENKCHHYADCLNTFGSYECSCKPGFSGNGMNCDDIDECGLLSHICDNCGNTDGMFDCWCNDGHYGGWFRVQSDLDAQENNLELEPYLKTSCPFVPFSCTEMPPSSCRCPYNFLNIGFTCMIIDKCRSGENDCHENASCIPAKNVGYTCQCNNGYTGNGFSCTDVDECESFRPPCTNCTNTIGGYSCGCWDGYDGDQCTDIDECTKGTHNCHPRATCTNTDGSYYCTCHDGYHVKGDNGTWCSGCVKDSWTAWTDFDHGYSYTETEQFAAGKGDFETISLARKSYPNFKLCENPTNIDVRLSNFEPYHKGGDRVHIMVDGFYCLNNEQDDWQCHNYYVRFCCPESATASSTITTQKDETSGSGSPLSDFTSAAPTTSSWFEFASGSGSGFTKMDTTPVPTIPTEIAFSSTTLTDTTFHETTQTEPFLTSTTAYSPDYRFGFTSGSGSTSLGMNTKLVFEYSSTTPSDTKLTETTQQPVTTASVTQRSSTSPSSNPFVTSPIQSTAVDTTPVRHFQTTLADTTAVPTTSTESIVSSTTATHTTAVQGLDTMLDQTSIHNSFAHTTVEDTSQGKSATHTTLRSVKNRLEEIFKPSTTEIVSEYTCVESFIKIRWFKSTLGLGHLYKLKVKDMKNQETKETRVQVVLTEEAYIETTSSSTKGCITATKLFVSNTIKVMVEVTAGRLKNQVKTISTVNYQGGKQSYKMTFVDLT